MLARKVYFFNQGFTLIELMITIAIIAVISAVGLVTYSQSQKIARDARRKQDLQNIAVALELYRQKNGRYPCTSGNLLISKPTANTFWITDDGCGTGPVIPFDQTYLDFMPNDPLSNNYGDNNSGKFGYSYRTPNCTSAAQGTLYSLRTRLENDDDPDSCKFKQYTSCSGATPVASICALPDANGNGGNVPERLPLYVIANDKL